MIIQFGYEAPGPYAKKNGKMTIKTDDLLFFKQLRRHFSEDPPGAAIARRRSSFFDPRKYAITPTGRCLPGLYWPIKKYLIEANIIAEIQVSRELNDILKPNDIVKFDEEITHNFIPREYQDASIKNGILLGRGIFKLATGAGKTFVTAALIEQYFRAMGSKDSFRCLVIVPDLGLVTQTYNEFNEVGVTYKVSMWSGKTEFDPEANVIICNIGILLARHNTNEWANYVDLLIVDEVHKIKRGSEASNTLDKIKTQRRYGMTGTLPTQMIDLWNINGHFGPVIYDKTSAELRDEDYLTNAHITILDMQYKQDTPRLSDNPWRDELDYIYEHEFRNETIKRICEKATGNILILVNHIAHGEILLENMHDLQNKQVYFVQGEMPIEERDKVKALMEERDDIVCIAISAIFSTGINIKNLPIIMFAAGGKSFIRTVQSIGRGLRKHKNKKMLTIIDIVDDLKYGLKHSAERCITYDKEKISYTTRTIKEG